MSEVVDEDLEWLREAWRAGKASGPGSPIDFDELREEARRRLKVALEAKAQVGLSVEKG